MLCSNIRHTLLVGVSVALAFLAPLSAAATEQRLVIRSARVLTMDAKQPEGRAIAIVDGRIAAVGSEEAIAPYIEGAQVYDLPGTLVLPGFQDAHNHRALSSRASISQVFLTWQAYGPPSSKGFSRCRRTRGSVRAAGTSRPFLRQKLPIWTQSQGRARQF